MLFLKTFPVGPFQCNCSIIADPSSGEAIVIDPGDEAERILTEISSLGFGVKYLIHTHAHIDHILGTRAVHEKTGAPICLHKDDQFLYDNIKMQGGFLGMTVDQEVLPVTKYIEHQDEIAFSKWHLKILHTPGHTPGSVCFSLKGVNLGGLKQNLLFSGDTLFYGSIGRTDLWGGDFNQILSSIKDKLLTLDEDTIVIPGHGQKTSIAREGQKNPFL